MVVSACRGPGDNCEGAKCQVEVLNQPPTLVITAPKQARTGQKISIDASKSADPEGGKLKFLWIEGEDNPANNFLDGLDLTASKLTFTPDVEGKFTYSVEVKDNEGAEAVTSVTIDVSNDYVPPDLKAPTITAVVINGITYPFSTQPSPVVFTTATGVLSIKALGTDPEDDADSIKLSTLYSTNVSGATTVNGKEYWVAKDYDAAQDDDPFATLILTVQLQDSDGLKSALKSIEVRVVPRATAQLTPVAAFVDCSAAPDNGLSMSTPANSLAAGYQAAMDNGLSDVFVAAGGTACKGTQVDFHGIRLWGLFDPADKWRRLTDPIDKVLNRVGSGERRYALRTTISDPTAYRLIYSSGSTYSTGYIFIDGFSFELSGFNYYAVSLTVGVTSDTVEIGLFNNEFVGNVTSVTSTIGVGIGWVPGGVLIRRNTSTASNGGTYLLRNLFAVDTTDSASVMQAWIDATDRTRDAGKIHFYANVFTGAIKNAPTYKCNANSTAAALVGFAFCLHQGSGNAIVGRNAFWANTVTNTVTPIVISSGNGKVFGYGNLFNTKKNAYTIRLTQTSDDGVSAKDGMHYYSAFPTDPTAVYVYLLTKSTGNAAAPSSFVCLLSGSFAASPCSSPDSRLVSIGSYNYDPSTLVHDPAQGWRTYTTTGVDTFVASDLGSAWNSFAAWDFDGNYGPIDNGTGRGAKYNAGAFEALP